MGSLTQVCLFATPRSTEQPLLVPTLQQLSQSLVGR